MSPVRLQVTISRFKARNLPDRNGGGGLLRLLRPTALPPDGPLRLQLQWGGDQLLTTGECTDVATGDDVAAGRSAGAAHKHWPDSFTFECNLSLDEMSSRRLELRLMRGVGEAAHTLGTVAVPLETLACAPALNDHALREPAEVQPSGARLAFRCRVSEQRGWRLRLRDLELRLQPSALEHDCASAGLTAALFSLAYTFTSGSTDQESHEQLWRAPQTRLLLVGRGEELRLSWGAAGGGGGGGGGVFGAAPAAAGVFGGEASLEWPSLAASREARRKGPGFLGADGFYDTGGAGRGRPAGGGGESGGAPAEAAAPEAAAVAPGPPPEVPDLNLPPSAVRQASGPPPEALPTIVHDGAFWEVRHGALRLTLNWRRCHTAAAVAAATWRRRASGGAVAAAASDDVGAAEAVETGAAEPGAGSAKAWVVMDKVLSDVQAVLQRRQRQRRRRKRRQRRLLAEAAAAGGVAARAAAAAAGEEEEEEGEEDWVGLDAGDEDEEDEDEDAAEEEGEEGEQGCVVVGVHEELYDHGRVVGTLCGKLAIDLPSVLQPDHGALTEAGHLAHGTPIVYENRNAGSFGSLGGGGSEAARLATLRAQLARAVERGDERGRTSAESALAQLLRTSHKESLFSFVFRDEASLQARPRGRGRARGVGRGTGRGALRSEPAPSTPPPPPNKPPPPRHTYS